jgi:8-oxo-dGTP diphosphatase
MTTYPATYCPDCGAALESRAVDGRDRRFCSSCDQVIWHTAVPCAGVAVVGEAGVLLVRRAIEPGLGSWSLPGGHLEAEESTPEGAARELAEETGIEVVPARLSLLDTFARATGDDKHVVSIGYVVDRSATGGDASAGQEVSEVGWFTPGSFDGTGGFFDRPHRDRFRRAWEWYQDRTE